MDDNVFSAYVQHLMLTDIAKAIPYEVKKEEIENFAFKVLDRFRNPFLQHKWINITLQNTMKMRNRNIPVILRYQQLHSSAPKYMATGFAGYLLFMKAVKKEDAVYYGKRGDQYYPINDDQAAYFYHLWNGDLSPDILIHQVLSNKDLWGEDISTFTSFREAVSEKLTEMLTHGVRHTINNI
jgi:tagaturonate reductase